MREIIRKYIEAWSSAGFWWWFAILSTISVTVFVVYKIFIMVLP